MLRMTTPLLALAATCAAAQAHTQDKPPGYPAKPIRIIIGIAPGGGLDAMSRLGAQKLTERWGQTVIVDNRPGGGTVLAMDMVSQAPPDGYTLLGASETLMMNGVLKRAPYDLRKTFIPVVQLTTQPYVLVVHPSVPAKTVKELVALAKAKPGALTYGSQGMGTTGHIGWERFNAMNGIDILHVPYKGTTTALPDLVSGRVSMIFDGGAFLPQVQAGKVKLLAVTSPRRLDSMPEVPTLAEAGVPGYDLSFWFGVVTPGGTPRPIVDKLSRDINEITKTQAFRERMASFNNMQLMTGTPEQMGEQIKGDIVLWQKLLKDAGVEPQ